MEGVQDDLWSPYKQLFKTIRFTFANPNESSIGLLEIYLKQHKQTFINILRNPPKSERNRLQLKNHVAQRIPITGNTRTTVLSKDLVDECIIISDMFDLDEFLALELLCTAQRQMAQYPGLSRGLIAILLYYDGRKAITTSLRDLFEVTNGVSWSSELPKVLTGMVSSYTSSLIDTTSILDRIIDLLTVELDITKETMLLTKNRALGMKSHQNQVFELFESIRLALALCLFNWSAQRSLPTTIIIRLIRYFFKINATDGTGSLDDANLIILLALLYSINTSHLQKDDIVQYDQLRNVVKDPENVQQIYNVLSTESIADLNNELAAVIKFSFGLYLAGLRHAAASQFLTNNEYKTIDYDEQLVDEAIAVHVFKYIYHHILEKKIIYTNEFFYRRIHQLFADFIEFMHSKVTDLRARADETAKTVLSFTKEGLDPPTNLDNNFEMLMLCIGKFYKDNRAGVSLCIKYWGPIDPHQNATFSKGITRSVALFKFLRLAGELLPTTLFVPYLKMLAGLSSCERSARNTFNLLKQSTCLSGNSTLSWEHFFTSLHRYYSNLKHEQSPSSETIYRNRITSRSINPAEIEGLRAVLGVIRSVATYDSIARITMCEHLTWNPLGTLIGLLSCSITLALKADILTTLTAFAKSKETAALLWNNLEVSQIISTMPTTKVYSVCNLEAEIEQNECRVERYALSLGVLDLLYELVSNGLPKNIGAGPRRTGFGPYLDFILNGIMLKFYNRNYKEPLEKWMIGEKCFKLVYHLLTMHPMQDRNCAEEQQQQQSLTETPGFVIMLQLQKKSDLLKLILMIIDDTRHFLEDYKQFHGKEHIENCVLHCLRILDYGLTWQELYIDTYTTLSENSMLLCGLKKILLDVNPRTKKPDYILNTTLFVMYSNWLPHHALEAVRILRLVCSQPNVTHQILGVLTQDEVIQNKLRQGFVECLDFEYVPTRNDQWDENSELESVKNTSSSLCVELQIKEAIIQLIQENLRNAPHNLAFFLLGIDYDKDHAVYHNQRLIIQDYGSNCTKSLANILDNQLEIKKLFTFIDLNLERIVEMAFCLLYELCSKQKTAEPVLRYLRSRNDLLGRHLSQIPIMKVDNASVLNEIGFLLKCTAIELKLASANYQLSRFGYICELFMGASLFCKINPDLKAKANGGTLTSEMTFMDTFVSGNSAGKSLGAPTNEEIAEKRNDMLLCDILNCVDIQLNPMQMPHWDYFDNALISQLLKECDVNLYYDIKLIDVTRMSAILCNELKIIQNTVASGQQKMIVKEIEVILDYAIKVNTQRRLAYATVKFVEAWCQMTEILFSCAPEACLPVQIKLDLIIETLQKIFGKVSLNQAMTETTVLISGTILLLLINLRYCCSHNSSETDIELTEITEAKDSMNNTTDNTTATTTGTTVKSLNVKSNSLNLKSILRNLIEWITQSAVSSQMLRINLYSSFLNCSNIVLGQDQIQQQQATEAMLETNEEYVLRLDKLKMSQHSLNNSNNLRVMVKLLTSFGDKLLEIICHDCIVGHDVCRMSALACMNLILDVDPTNMFLNFIAHHGYLAHIIDGLLKSDNELMKALHNVPENIKSLYVYEGKMAMLLRMANTHTGAEMLLSHRLLEVLSSMNVFNMHPDTGRNEIWHKKENTEFLPSIDARFRQILFPALHLCECLLSTLGVDNRSVVAQIMHFLLSHIDMIETVLRTTNINSDLGLLQELSYICGIIANSFNQESLVMRDHFKSLNDANVNAHRLQNLMLSVLSRFIVNDANIKDVLKVESAPFESNSANKVLHLKCFLQIAANTILFCRNVITNHSPDHRTESLLFVPRLNNISQIGGIDGSRNAVLHHQFNIDIIINQLKGCVEYYHSQKTVMESYVRQKSLLGSSFRLESSAKSKYLELLRKFEEKQSELCLCIFIIQQCLFLLWAHLDFYVRYVHNNNSHDKMMQNDLMHTIDSQIGFKITTEDVTMLRKSLVQVFNETFSKQLCSVADLQTSEFQTGFNKALVRRIKTLIQFSST